MNEKNRSGIYIRVSTEEQAKDGFSIHAQKEKLTKYAEANDWEIYDYYIDDGISGKNLEGRPEVMRLLKDVKCGKVNNVLIYKLDRLTRSVRDLIYLIEIFEKYQCTFNSQTEKIDTSNAVGRMFVKIIGIFAEFERENLAERVSFGYEQKTREGNYTNTNGVYGYDYIVGKQKLIVNEFEKKIVNQVFHLYIDGTSYYKIAQNFNANNIPTKRGGKWSASTIKSIINNPLYIGKVRYGVHEKNKEKRFITNGNHIPCIVKEEIWNLANKISNARTKWNIRRYPSEFSYYFPIIKCSKCGKKLIAKQQQKSGKTYITYRCIDSFNGKCNSEGFSHQKMEKSFLNYLQSLGCMIVDKKVWKTNDIYSYEQVKDFIGNFKMNWEYLTDNEKKQFLQRFVEIIQVEKQKNDVVIRNIEFKLHLL